ncbi:type II restriction endonuclease HpaII [Clostridia bacterium]|nr:type II restriction endonuclease HpaII [Clostridia bacterium]
MAQIKGNKGEWSEIYAFLRLLSVGKLFAADEELNRIESMFFPVLKIIREEVRGTKYEYLTGDIVKICLGDTPVMELPATTFNSEANKILDVLLHRGAGSGSFSVEDTETFMRKIHVNVLKARSTDKSDINVQLRDVNTGFEQVVGFSIKSELGSSPTLLNAGKTTNFIYRVDGLPHDNVSEINAIDTDYKILDRISAIKANGGTFSFIKTANDTLANNLIMIDSQMAVVVAEMLVVYYSGTAKTCTELLKNVTALNPLSRPAMFYEYKVKELLCAVALGMKPATPWDGSDEATGGYIVVKTDGEVLAYHIYNRDSFKGYLLSNTRFESGGTTRHDYAVLYEENDEVYIKLNLQIRFI